MNENEANSLSRRHWLQRMSVPALALAGAGFIPQGAKAAPAGPGKADANLQGAKVYNIRDFGAKGDGKTNDSAAVQAAIDACNTDKGGMVLVPAGDFIIGTVELKSNVTLHLSAQGRLLGSARREDYQAGKGVPPGNGNLVLLYAVNASNLSIEGRGTIDGNGGSFYNGLGDGTSPGGTGKGNTDRPHLLIFYHCTGLLLRDTFFTRSAYHCMRILQCRQVHIDGVRIYNRINKNNDGFHINSCEYVHISNCDVQCQDDACALFGSNVFVTVTNCTFSTRWSIFRFGSGSSKNITVSNCLIYDTYGCPIKISAGRAQIENLCFSNIVMKNVTGPISIAFGRPNRGNGSSGAATGAASFLRNVSFNGIRATVVPQPVNHPDIPFDVKVNNGEQYSCITLNGMDDAFLEDISFTDVHVSYAGGGTVAMAAKAVPAVNAEYFGVWAEEPYGPPAYGLYARNVKGLRLQNVRFDYEQPDARPAMVFDNVQDALVNGLSAQGSPETSLLRFVNSKDVLLTATRVLTPAPVFLQIAGASSDGIIIDGGDLRKAAKSTMLADGAGEKSVVVRI